MFLISYDTFLKNYMALKNRITFYDLWKLRGVVSRSWKILVPLITSCKSGIFLEYYVRT